MRRKVVTALVAIAAIAVGSFLARRHYTLETIAAEEARLRDALDAHPLTAFLFGLVVYVVLSFIPPTAGKSLFFGWLYGLWQGVLLVNIGLTIAAIGMFVLSRYVLRDGLRSRFGAYVARVDKAIRTDGAYYLFALRVMHAPYTFLNYAMGATCIRTRDFWWATQTGMLPGNLLFVYAGTRLPTLEELSREGLVSLASPELIGALVLLGLFPLLVRFVLRRVRRRRAGADVGR